MNKIRLLSATIRNRIKSNQNSTIQDNSYSIVLEDTGNYKIYVIEAIRDVTGLGLKEAFDLIKSLPYVIKTDLTIADAEQIQKTFSDLGERVTIEKVTIE